MGLVHANAASEFAGNLFLGALDGCSHFTFAFLRRFFIKLTTANFGQNSGFFTGALETADGDFEGFVIFYTYIWHTNSS